MLKKLGGAIFQPHTFLFLKKHLKISCHSEPKAKNLRAQPEVLTHMAAPSDSSPSALNDTRRKKRTAEKQGENRKTPGTGCNGSFRFTRQFFVKN